MNDDFIREAFFQTHDSSMYTLAEWVEAKIAYVDGYKAAEDRLKCYGNCGNGNLSKALPDKCTQIGRMNSICDNWEAKK